MLRQLARLWCVQMEFGHRKGQVTSLFSLTSPLPDRDKIESCSNPKLMGSCETSFCPTNLRFQIVRAEANVNLKVRNFHHQYCTNCACSVLVKFCLRKGNEQLEKDRNKQQSTSLWFKTLRAGQKQTLVWLVVVHSPYK